MPSRRLFAFCFLIAAGCNNGPTTVPVSGIVTYPDGSPVTYGTVEFETVGQEPPVTATGEISATGEFRLGTFSSADGVVPGQHRAVVVADYRIGTSEERPALLPEATVHGKYRDFETSDLKFTVTAATTDLKIVVDAADAKK